MNKQKVMETLTNVHDKLRKERMAPANIIMDIAACLEWIDQTETIDEAREALEELEERTGDELCYFKLFNDGDMAVGYHKDNGTATYNRTEHDISSIKDIDFIAQEPSDEPPNPNEIKNRTKVPTLDGYVAYIWHSVGRTTYTGVVEGSQTLKVAWSCDWMSDGSTWGKKGNFFLDWKTWRKDNE